MKIFDAKQAIFSTKAYELTNSNIYNRIGILNIKQNVVQNNALHKGEGMATIFCDTDCELWYTHANELNLQVIQMPYVIDGEEKMCDLGENTDIKGFYTKMREGANASTAGLNQQIYYDIFKPFFEKGDDILYIAFSSNLSGTFAYLDLAIAELKEEYPNVKYRKFDTLNICMGAGLLVYMGAKYCREHGDDIDATCDYLDSLVNKVGVYFVVDDMKYLARGGRISPAKAKIGNLMNIKPVLTVVDGKLDVCSKQNGVKKAYKFMLETFKETYEDIDGAPVTIVDADNEEASKEFAEKIKEIAPNATVWQQPVGPVIGAHAGPGTIGIMFTKK